MVKMIGYELPTRLEVTRRERVTTASGPLSRDVVIGVVYTNDWDDDHRVCLPTGEHVGWIRPASDRVGWSAFDVDWILERRSLPFKSAVWSLCR